MLPTQKDDTFVARAPGIRPSGRRRAALLLTLVLSAGGLGASSYARSRPTPPAAPRPAAPLANAPLTTARLAMVLCALKDSIRWRKPAWSAETCQQMADHVLAAAAKHQVSPALIVAVMLNESDLDERANLRYARAGAVYAQDMGLMGIRCVFDRRGRCKNGRVRGRSPREIAAPRANIDFGASELADDRTGVGVERRTVRTRLAGGGFGTRTKLVRCRHAGHAYWAHYNHGSFYISRGSARHYPHRVGVLYYALAQALDLPTEPALGRQLTVRDPGRPLRTADQPVEARFRVLCDKIYRAARDTQRPAPQLALAEPPARG